jgi:hypothetical protein
MLDNLMSLTKIGVCNRRKNIVLVLAMILILASAASSDILAAGNIQADGMLTSIEIDGTVVIDNMGYSLSRSLRVQDYEGMPISLRDINLPYHVHFEYEYAPEGFMIIFIKENAG